MKKKIFLILLRTIWTALICLALLLAIYLPVNNVVEYWPCDAQDMSWHFAIFTFLGLSFFVLFGTALWSTASPLARRLGPLAIVGWLLDLFIISNNPYLQNTWEPYAVGSMIIIVPCLVLLLDRWANTIRDKLRGSGVKAWGGKGGKGVRNRLENVRKETMKPIKHKSENGS